MSTMPLRLASNAVQSTGSPSAMPTPRTSSSTVTSPLPSQSPVHESAGGSVGLGVADGVGLGESLTIDVDPPEGSAASADGDRLRIAVDDRRR